MPKKKEPDIFTVVVKLPGDWAASARQIREDGFIKVYRDIYLLDVPIAKAITEIQEAAEDMQDPRLHLEGDYEGTAYVQASIFGWREITSHEKPIVVEALRRLQEQQAQAHARKEQQDRETYLRLKKQFESS